MSFQARGKEGKVREITEEVCGRGEGRHVDGGHDGRGCMGQEEKEMDDLLWQPSIIRLSEL